LSPLLAAAQVEPVGAKKFRPASLGMPVRSKA